MTSEPFDPETFKAGQRQDWDSASAGWMKWWEGMELAFQPVSDRLVAMAELQPGHRILDIATGIGEPAVTAARKVTDSGRVVATDQAPGMLKFAKERAESHGLQNIEFHEIDSEELDFPENSFDAALCRWGLMFLPNLAGTLNRIHRMIVPGGKFATSVWSTPDKVPFISLPMRVVRQELQLPLPPQGIPGVFSLADSDALKKTFTQAGFKDVHVESVSVTNQYSSAENFVEQIRDVSAAVNVLLADKTDEVQTRIWNAISNAVEHYATSEGTISITSEAICIVGQK